jgi:hypothetical protein
VSVMPSPEPNDPTREWNDILDLADDAEYARLEGLSKAELEAELKAAGYYEAKRASEAKEGTPAAIVPPATASGSDVAHVYDVGPPSEGKVTSLDARRKRRGVPFSYYVYAAAAVILAAVAAKLDLFGDPRSADPNHPDKTVPHDTPAPNGPTPEDPKVTATGLRAQAQKACDSQSWGECGKLLDAASAKDPGGESASDVKAMRAKIQAEVDRILEGEKKKGR